MGNVLICGVGGQGVILASDILADVALKNNYDVKKAEVHGMSQRGGSVVTHVKFAEKVNSPLIRKGEADVLMSFEPLESLRYLDFLSPHALVIINEHKIVPPTLTLGKSKYPDNINDILSQHSKQIIALNAAEEAIKIGNVKTINVLMLGILSNSLPFSEESWLEVISAFVPQKALELNKTAFLTGRKYK